MSRERAAVGKDGRSTKRRSRSMVFVDLETTGLDTETSEIIEFAAVRVTDGQPAGEFSRLANPGRPLPLAITRLTGITDRDLRRQPPSRTVLGEFLQFLGDDVLVAHNARFDLGFLRDKSDGFCQNASIDTLELCRILYPTLEHHDLDTMAATLELETGDRHRALDDTRLLVQLWAKLLERIEGLPFDVLAALSAVSNLTQWPARRLFLEAEARRLDSAFDVAAPNYHSLLTDFGSTLTAARDSRRKQDPSSRPPPKRLDTAELTALFAAGGPFDQEIPGYEVRPQQARMVELVAQAFNEGQHLLVEAGTGVGKSMAYLVPAIRWAQTNQDKIVISTNTKNLQEQLYFKDIPLLRETLGLEFATALIKGRSNYLCVRKLLYLLEEGEHELTDDERIAFLPILVWAADTKTGDAAECTGFLAFRQRDLWAKLCSTAEECAGPNCRQRRRCFLSRARALSLLSDVVVANHAVVFAELDLDSVVLPKYAHLVFDEAHNLEDAATDYLGCQIDRWRVSRFTRRLLHRERRGPDRGLLPSIRYRMKKGREATLTDLERDAEKLIDEGSADVASVEQRLDAFLDTVGAAFEASSRAGESVRYDAERGYPQHWGVVEDDKRALVSVIAGLCKRIERLVEQLEALAERDFPYRVESMYDLRGIGEAFTEIKTSLDFLVEANDEGFVYWIERYGRRRPHYRLASAPVRVGPKMKELLYDRKDTIIFTSATLSAARSFQFLKDRVGLDQVEKAKLIEEDVGSPFDYDRQMLVLVPNYIEPPSRENTGFAGEVARALIDLFRASAGRGLALFTSYMMLDEVYPQLKTALEAERILVLGQGFDGERRALTRMFRRDTSSVLLGTDSFWEGVDVPGEALSCLVIVKLPFAVHTAPVVQARCEEVEARGFSAFRHYTLPSAVIRFKQGAGRLIRSKTDFGVVAALDRRVLTRNYGRHFLRSLPTSHRTCTSPRHMCDMIRAFLRSRQGSAEGDE